MFLSVYSGNRYPQFSEEDIAKICPFCRGNCNCNLCLHSSAMSKVCLFLRILKLSLEPSFCLICFCSEEMLGSFNAQMPKRDLTDLQKAQHLEYLVNSLLPFLKQIHEEQSEEIVMESVIKGKYLPVKSGFTCLIIILYYYVSKSDFVCIGILSSSIEIEQSLCYNDERIYW